MRAIIIEDSTEIAECMEHSLADMGITSDTFAKGSEFRQAISIADYDLLVMDLNLPDADGLKLIKEFRVSHAKTPILIVSARTSIDDRVEGLDIGADDYLIKPFDLHEFDARVRALVRRSSEETKPQLILADLVFDQTSRQFKLAEQEMELSPRERAVLEILLRQNCKIISKERIANHVFNFDDEASVTSIEIYIHRLRKKLNDSGVTINTVRGLGYTLKINE
ncbi:MAG: response regulator transcription factor [Arenicella sp.]|nr:response regulator transcription factor [Arenicella sp.]